MIRINNTMNPVKSAYACQDISSEIRTNDDIKSLQQIIEEQEIDHKQIVKDGFQGWFKLKNPIKIPTRFGDKEVHRVWYNGKQIVKRITFNDNSSYRFTLNHKLFNFVTNRWSYVDDLIVGDKIASIDGDKYKKVINIKELNFFDTWDIEVKEVNEYLLGNGCISHNTSGKSINAIESIEPIHDFFKKKVV
jgi:intein/homing endonuclease